MVRKTAARKGLWNAYQSQPVKAEACVICFVAAAEASALKSATSPRPRSMVDRCWLSRFDVRCPSLIPALFLNLLHSLKPDGQTSCLYDVKERRVVSGRRKLKDEQNSRRARSAHALWPPSLPGNPHWRPQQRCLCGHAAAHAIMAAICVRC